MIYINIKDQIAFCEGEKEFDKSHFYTLFMKTDYEGHVTEREYDQIFRYVPNSAELISRIKNYYYNYLIEVNDIDKYKEIANKEYDIEIIFLKE